MFERVESIAKSENRGVYLQTTCMQDSLKQIKKFIFHKFQINSLPPGSRDGRQNGPPGAAGLRSFQTVKRNQLSVCTEDWVTKSLNTIGQTG